MKRLKIIGILFLITNMLIAQENIKGDLIVGFTIGASFSNLLHSEAPHKINYYGSDVNPAIFSSFDLTTSPGYIDYETGIFKDILYGLTSAVQIEYFIKDDLSVLSGISYESKGINLNYSNTLYDYITTGDVLFEKYKLKIINNYVTIPFLMRKYILRRKNVFVSGGAYLGYLIATKFDYFNHKELSDETGPLGSSSFWASDKNKNPEITNKLDYGFSVGTGYVHNITDNLVFKTELLFNVGLRKVDSKYNNEFSVTSIPTGSNLQSVAVRSTNYYGLNSNAKNMNMLITVGLGYRFYK